MKKRLIAILVFACGFGSLSAQEESLKPLEGDWGILLNINGLINNIQINNNTSPYNTSVITGKYYLTDSKVLRLDIGPRISSVKTMREDSVGANLVGVDSTTTNTSLYLAAGIEKHFKGTKRLDPYIVGQVGLGFIGKTKVDTEIRDVSSIGTETTTITYEQDGGFSLGIMGTAGFNYFLAKNFALGAEYSVGYNFLKQGGNFSEITQVNPISGGITSEVKKGKDQTNKNTFEVEGAARLLISFYF